MHRESRSYMLKNQNHSEEGKENGEREGGKVGGSEGGETEIIYAHQSPIPALEVTHILTPGILLWKTSTPIRKNKTRWFTSAAQHLGGRRKAYSHQRDYKVKLCLQNKTRQLRL